GRHGFVVPGAVARLAVCVLARVAIAGGASAGNCGLQAAATSLDQRAGADGSETVAVDPACAASLVGEAGGVFSSDQHGGLSAGGVFVADSVPGVVRAVGPVFVGEHLDGIAGGDLLRAADLLRGHVLHALPKGGRAQHARDDGNDSVADGR